MMERVSRASREKAAQGYVAKGKNCGNCAHFESTMVHVPDPYGSYERETKKRCGLGAFMVQKQATCNCYEPKPVAAGQDNEPEEAAEE